MARSKGGRPPKRGEAMTEAVTANVPESWKTWVRRQAESLNVSEGDVVRYCIELGMATSRFQGPVSLVKPLDPVQQTG